MDGYLGKITVKMFYIYVIQHNKIFEKKSCLTFFDSKFIKYYFYIYNFTKVIKLL